MVNCSNNFPTVLNYTKSIKNFILDLIFPKFCCGCGQYGEFLCPRCFNELGKQPHFVSAAWLAKKKRVPKIFSRHVKGVWYFWDYNDRRVKDILKQYKFRQIRGLSYYFRILFGQFFRKIKDIDIVMIAPDKKRLKARGFDHILETLPLKSVSENVRLTRIKNTAIQSLSSNRQERFDSLKGAFRAEAAPGARAENRTIFLVDDILTSGATALSAARALRLKGCQKIYLAVLAYRRI